MKIAFVHAEKEFNEKFFDLLKIKLTAHELISWKTGLKAPADDFDAAIVMGEFSREEMKAQPRLKLIQTASAGYDGIDVDAATELGITVAFAPSGETGNAISVAEFAVLLILGASRSLNQVIRPGHDNKTAPGVSTALHGKTVCIIGMGTIGRLLAERLIPFGVKITATDDHLKEVPEQVTVFKNAQWNDAVSDADYVVLCVRGTTENENLINAENLKSMKKGSVLINVARGSLIDEEALIGALNEGHLTYAGLDVVKDEPLETGNPLLSLPQVLLTPHVAGTTDITLSGTIEYVGKVIIDYANGIKPEAVVNHPESHSD